MANTIVAIYRDDGNAQLAAEELKKNGFSIENMRLEHDDRTQEKDRGIAKEMPHGSRGMMEFFTSRIGAPGYSNIVTTAQAEAMRQGNSMIIVRMQDGRQAGQATDIINRHHPIAVDEHWTQ
jgi:hypothetical protein